MKKGESSYEPPVYTISHEFAPSDALVESVEAFLDQDTTTDDPIRFFGTRYVTVPTGAYDRGELDIKIALIERDIQRKTQPILLRPMMQLAQIGPDAVRLAFRPADQGDLDYFLSGVIDIYEAGASRGHYGQYIYADVALHALRIKGQDLRGARNDFRERAYLHNVTVRGLSTDGNPIASNWRADPPAEQLSAAS